MKKVAVIVLVALMGLSVAGFAAANGLVIGAEFAVTNLSGYGALLTFHIGDYWLAHGRLVGMVDYYVGLGFRFWF